jgi:phosphatidylserine/phosphatidylglycerophosphate/cardiolipin synthase-like enzyme
MVLSNTIAKTSFERMIILVPGAGSIQGELHQVWRRRINFWNQLGASASKKVSIYAYRADPESPILVHSKAWIFDDTFAVVSSANSNRRGYSHDSEVGAGIADPNSHAYRLNWAHELRISLWLKHLNRKTSRVSRADVIDFVKAASYWNPDPHSIIEALDLAHPSYAPPDQVTLPLVSFDYEWDNLLDPEGS